MGLCFWPRCLVAGSAMTLEGDRGEKFGELRKDIGPGDGN